MPLSDLPTLAEVQAARVGKPISKGVSRLDAAMAADTDDARQLRRWAAEVKARDGGICRVCGVQTITTCELDERRGEAHHIVSRTTKVIRHNSKNGIWTCARCHRRFKARTLFVVGTAAQMFKVGKGITAHWYLDGDLKLKFSERCPT